MPKLSITCTNDLLMIVMCLPTTEIVYSLQFEFVGRPTAQLTHALLIIGERTESSQLLLLLLLLLLPLLLCLDFESDHVERTRL